MRSHEFRWWLAKRCRFRKRSNLQAQLIDQFIDSFASSSALSDLHTTVRPCGPDATQYSRGDKSQALITWLAFGHPRSIAKQTSRERPSTKQNVKITQHVLKWTLGIGIKFIQILMWARKYIGVFYSLLLSGVKKLQVQHSSLRRERNRCFCMQALPLYQLIFCLRLY